MAAQLRRARSGCGGTGQADRRRFQQIAARKRQACQTASSACDRVLSLQRVAWSCWLPRRCHWRRQGRSCARGPRQACRAVRPPSSPVPPRPRRGRALPSSAMARLSLMVAIRVALAFLTASMSNTPRSISVRTTLLAACRFSALAFSRSLVRSLASRTASAASRERWMVTACASWVSHKRHGVDEGRVDLGDQRLVVFLHQPDRGQRLHRHLPRQFQIMHPAFQIIAGGRADRAVPAPLMT